MTQCAAILAHLRTGTALSPLEALDRFGCFRLAARIYELRAQGHDIRMHTVMTIGGTYVAEYYLGPPDLFPRDLDALAALHDRWAV